MSKAFLSLGTNMGDKIANLLKAVEFIGKEIGTVVVLSQVYETEPWGFEADSSFYNMVIEVDSLLTPIEMISHCLAIETHLGRVRTEVEGYSSRIIDIDILFYNNLVRSGSELILPHPHLEKRRFVLEPLSEIASGYKHPVLNLTVAELLTLCPDQSEVTSIGLLAH